MCAGVNWIPQLVGWGSVGRAPNTQLLGYYAGKLDQSKGRLTETQTDLQTLDFWQCQGIYVLFQSDAVIYAGRSDTGGIGARLKAHYQTDNLAGRWDSFSWFSPWEPVEEQMPDGSKRLKFGPQKSSIASIPTDEWLSEMEAFAILCSAPRENRQTPNLHQMVWYFTQRRSEFATKSTDEMIAAIYESIKGK